MSELSFETSADNVASAPEFPASGTLKAGSFPGSVGYAAQGAPAAFEALYRMGAGMVGQTGGALVGGAEAIPKLLRGDTAGGAEQVRSRMGQGGEWVTEKIAGKEPYFDPTKQFEETLGEGFEHIREFMGTVGERAVGRKRPKGTPGGLPFLQAAAHSNEEVARMRGERAAIGRTMGEYAFDAPAAVVPVQVLRGALNRVKRKPAAEEAVEKPLDTTKYNPTELDFPQEGSLIPPGTRSPYNLRPEERARLEAELNPPVERRGEAPAYDRRAQERDTLERREQPRTDQIPGQGELFTNERPYPEAFPGEGRPSPLEPSARGRAIAGREDVLDIPDVTNQRVRPADELATPTRQIGGQENLRPLPFEERPTVNPGMGDTNLEGLRNMARAEGRDPSRPIPYDPSVGPHQLPVKGGRMGGPESGGVTVPFGKAAETVRTKLEARIEQIHSTYKRIVGLLDEGKVESKWANKRLDELSQEMAQSRKKEGSVDDISYKDKHPQYQSVKGLGSAKTAWDENGNLRRKAEVLPFKGPGSSQRGAIGTIEKGIAKKGIVPTIQSTKKFWLEDTKRPLAQALKEDHPDLKPENVVDVAPAGSKAADRWGQLIQKGLSNFLIDKQLSIMSQGKGAISTAIKWVVDNQNSLNRQLKMRIDENTNAALKEWRQLHKTSPKELREMLTVWTESIGKERLAEASFRTEKQFKVYEAVNQILTDGLQRTNEARAKAKGADGRPMKPIDFTENYFPSIRKGDWWIYVHDASGNLKGAFAFETTIAANKAHRALKKDMGVEFDVREPALKKLTEKDLSSFDAYRETLKALHDGDPIAIAIQKRYAYLAGHRGFGRTGIYRKGIPGALGFEEGKLGVKNAEKVLESYINRQETYITNLDRAQLQRQVAEQAHLFKKAPIAEQWMAEYLSRSKGADLDMMPFIRKGVDALSTDVFGTSRGVVPKFIQKTSSIASLMYLATVRNIVVNMTQALNTLAKLVDLRGLDKTVHNPVHAIFEGLVDALNPDALAKEGRQWAKKHGSMESAIVNIIEGKLADFKSEGGKLVGEVLRYGLGKVEQGAVRIPAFHMFERTLRETVPNKLERFEMAANMMDNYMVHYDRESSPLVYDKLGPVVGESTRGLKTYAHNYYGQFFEYLQTAKDQGRVAPLAAFLGTGVLIGGLRGLIGVAEATAIINLLNAIPGFDLDIPTPEQLMLKLGLNDMLLFGGVSTILSKDISASVSAPAMPALFNAVPIEFSWDIASSVFPYVVKRIGGTATEADEMKALVALAPKQMTGWVELLYLQDGMIPDPNNKMAAKYPAPQEGRDMLERFGLNFKTLDEAKFNMITRSTKQLIARDIQQRFEALDAIADRVSTGKEITPELVQQYVKEGGSVNGLMAGVKQRLTDRQLDPQERMMQGKSISPERAHKLNRMKEVMDESLRQRMDEKVPSGFHKQSAEVGGEERMADLISQQKGQAAVIADLKTEAKYRFPKSPVKAKIWVENQLSKHQESADEFDAHKGRMLDFNMQRDRRQVRI